MPRKLSAGICPPGILCLTPSLGFLLLAGIAIALFFMFKATQLENPGKQKIQIFNSIPGGGMEGGDDRYTRAPEPLRVWQTPPDLRGAMLPPGAVPINIPTRGLPQAFQQSGIIKTGDQVLPLYGRQTAYRTDRYNYYTRTDTYNPVQLPVRYQKRDCMDSIGCEELLGGESVQISGIGKSGDVEVFRFDGPAYIPGLV
jgi:hypothetical protein